MNDLIYENRGKEIRFNSKKRKMPWNTYSVPRVTTQNSACVIKGLSSFYSDMDSSDEEWISVVSKSAKILRTKKQTELRCDTIIHATRVYLV